MKVLGVLSLSMMRLKESTVMADGFFRHKNEEKNHHYFFLAKVYLNICKYEAHWLVVAYPNQDTKIPVSAFYLRQLHQSQMIIF